MSYSKVAQTLCKACTGRNMWSWVSQYSYAVNWILFLSLVKVTASSIFCYFCIWCFWWSIMDMNISLPMLISLSPLIQTSSICLQCLRHGRNNSLFVYHEVKYWYNSVQADLLAFNLSNNTRWQLDIYIPWEHKMYCSIICIRIMCWKDGM
jgi:hypothetical protein